MKTFVLQLVPTGTDIHRSDVSCLQNDGLAIPHDYASWPLHHRAQSWIWCRVLDADGNLLTGFAVQCSLSRAIPGMRIGRIDRIGRNLHERVVLEIGDILAQLSRRIPRLLRLDVQIFDEDNDRHHLIAESLRRAGACPARLTRCYRKTLILNVRQTDEALLTSFSSRTRRNLKKLAMDSLLVTKPVTDVRYASRIELLLAESFRRTGGDIPPHDVLAMLADSKVSSSSVLMGAFLKDSPAPEDLVAFAWARMHGDHAVYDFAGAERRDSISHLAPGAAVMWGLICWARENGASWFDLGGVLPLDVASSHPQNGISIFKRGFSSDEHEVSSEYEFEPRPILAELARCSSGFVHFAERQLRGRFLKGLTSS